MPNLDVEILQGAVKDLGVHFVTVSLWGRLRSTQLRAALRAAGRRASDSPPACFAGTDLMLLIHDC